MPPTRPARTTGHPSVRIRPWPGLPASALVVAIALGAVAGSVAVAPAPPASAATAQAAPSPPDPPSRYAPPVDAPIVDPFRPPPHRYGPGNRGLSYGVAPLTPVRAVGDGEVIFAGAVAGTLHVTIRHADGLRSSYSYLAAPAVQPGDQVRLGDLVGWTSEVFHLGVRRPDGEYLDPELLWRGRGVPVLVPGGDDGADPVPEAAALLEVVRDRSGPLAAWVTSSGTTLVGWSPSSLATFEHRLRLLHHYATELLPSTHRRRLLAAVDRWAANRRECTATDVAVAPPPERRIVVQVGGIGSTSDDAAIADLDTAALGYDPGDVLRFSYEGGRIPPREVVDDRFGSLETNEYHQIASQNDLHESGRRLADLLDDVARAAPGVPIDVVAHSQGGVVARLAIDHGEATGTRPVEVRTLVTLGSPHQGADLATAVDAARTDAGAAAQLDRIRRQLGVELDPALPAATQLSEVSPVVDELRTARVPDGVRFTSVAARGDIVVAEGRTDAPGARRSTVSLSGVGAHDELPGSPEATREVLLAITGRPPTCRSLPATLVDAAVGDGIGLVTDGAGAAALGVGTVWPGS